jgi:hypothetical protein
MSPVKSVRPAKEAKPAKAVNVACQQHGVASDTVKAVKAVTFTKRTKGAKHTKGSKATKATKAAKKEARLGLGVAYIPLRGVSRRCSRAPSVTLPKLCQTSRNLKQPLDYSKAS